jgi:hypothetical protein
LIHLPCVLGIPWLASFAAWLLCVFPFRVLAVKTRAL